MAQRRTAHRAMAATPASDQADQRNERQSASTQADEATEAQDGRRATPGGRGAAASAPLTSPAAAVVIERLILHHLDHRAERCDLVGELAALDETGLRFFAGHLASAAERADWHARFRTDDDTVPGQLLALLGETDAQFVEASQALAQRLYGYMRSGSGNIVPGDFVVIAYRLGAETTRHVALLKMDPDQQRLTRAFTGHGAQRRVAISLAANLLPEAKSLQKCALISRANADDSFSVRLLDTQAGPRSDGVAAFFYRDFLAASLTASSRRQTRLFLAETNAWLAQHGAEFEPRDLLTFYKARRDTLAGEVVPLREFSAAALPSHADLAEELTQRLIAAVLDDPDLRGAHPFFPVDRAAAKSYLEKVTLELDGGMRLTVSASRFEELVKIAEERADGRTITLTLQSLALREVV